MAGRKRTTSVRQIELLIDYMEQHRDLALGRVRSMEARALAGRLWAECAGILNSEGAFRTPKEWSRFWNDYKCRVRTKLTSITRTRQGTGGGPNDAPNLTALEDRVASLIGRDVGPLAGVRRDPIIVEAEVHYEEVQPQPTFEIVEDSPTLNLSAIEFLSEPVPETSSHNNDNTEQVMAEPGPSSRINIVMENNPNTENTYSHIEIEPPRPENNTMPQRGNRNRRAVGARQRSLRERERGGTELEEARASVARVEEIRARTEQLVAEANLQQARVSASVARSVQVIAEAVQVIAEAVQQALTRYNLQ